MEGPLLITKAQVCALYAMREAGQGFILAGLRDGLLLVSTRDRTWSISEDGNVHRGPEPAHDGAAT